MNDIKREDYFVDSNIEKAESLPSSAFTDPMFLQLEMDKIFRRSWMLAPINSQSSSSKELKAGTRIPFKVLDKPLFLQVNSRLETNCFPNVCTHAWHPLVEQTSIGGSIICPQHGREFDADGRFLSHRGFESLENFPRESDSLRKLEVERWGPLVFVSLGRPLLAIKKIMKEVQESIPGIDPGSLKYRPVANEIREVPGNWKQHAWNYMDNYHIRFVHKGPEGLAGAIDLESYSTELHEYSALQWAYAKHSQDGFALEQVAPRFQDPNQPSKRVFALWWFIFPNLTLNFYPWGLSVNQYMPVPSRPEKTEFHWYEYSLDEAKFKQRNKVWLNQQVDTEDIEAIAVVNDGARSGLAPRGRFAPKEETGPHWLHRLIYTSLFQEE